MFSNATGLFRQPSWSDHFKVPIPIGLDRDRECTLRHFYDATHVKLHAYQRGRSRGGQLPSADTGGIPRPIGNINRRDQSTKSAQDEVTHARNHQRDDIKVHRLLHNKFWSESDARRLSRARKISGDISCVAAFARATAGLYDQSTMRPFRFSKSRENGTNGAATGYSVPGAPKGTLTPAPSLSVATLERDKHSKKKKRPSRRSAEARFAGVRSRGRSPSCDSPPKLRAARPKC